MSKGHEEASHRPGQDLRVLVTGAGGQLGQSIRQVLKLTGPVGPLETAVRVGSTLWHFADRHTLDITKSKLVAEAITAIQPDVILNCAAYTAVDRAEQEPELADAVNRNGVVNLLNASARGGSFIIHISTDYVFGNSGAEPHHELEIPSPRCVYARTKRDGELALLGTWRAMVIRTSWLYSQYGHNFFRTVLSKCEEGAPMRVVYDQVGCPTWAGSLAAALVRMVDQRKWSAGMYHYSDLGVASWYDMAMAIRSLAGAGNSIEPIRSHEYPSQAARPTHSVLDSTKSRRELGLPAVHWLAALQECYQGMQGGAA